jgi:RimJ/RimL family protein N-acetyltransferase
VPLPLTTERLRLRRLAPADRSTLVAYRSDERVARLQSWSSMSLEDADALIAARDDFGTIGVWVQVAIARADSDELIGDVGVHVRPPGDTAEIGFSMAPSAQGRGYAAEACRAVIAELFATTGVRAVEAVIDARNAAAIGLVGRLGFALVGTDVVEFKGERCTEHRFVLRR